MSENDWPFSSRSCAPGALGLFLFISSTTSRLLLFFPLAFASHLQQICSCVFYGGGAFTGRSEFPRLPFWRSEQDVRCSSPTEQKEEGSKDDECLAVASEQSEVERAKVSWFQRLYKGSLTRDSGFWSKDLKRTEQHTHQCKKNKMYCCR